jgi:NADH:ubiquinone oxidoreductase subunit 5 (subunit L)/multisubunit Na+/H+ antiporter MnhA subunit
MHIAMHALGKITLFFCAGAIYTATHKTKVSELDGIGRVMPFTMFAFLLGALSVIGLPPFGGSWSKWYLALGAADAGYIVIVAVLMISSLLNVAYLLPVVGRAFFLPPIRGRSSHGAGACRLGRRGGRRSAGAPRRPSRGADFLRRGAVDDRRRELRRVLLRRPYLRSAQPLGLAVSAVRRCVKDLMP